MAFNKTIKIKNTVQSEVKTIRCLQILLLKFSIHLVLKITRIH